MIAAGLATASEAIFDLDFHAVMHWGHDPALEKHYVPTRSQRARSVLTFFAQDTGTHNLVYANADLSKASQDREVIAFCDHWKAVSGADPEMLIMDQKVTTQAILGELDDRGVKFATLRMRSPALMRHINSPGQQRLQDRSPSDRPGPHNKPKVAEDPGRQAHQLPRHRPPAHRHRPGPRRPHRHHHQRRPDHHPGPDRAVRPADDHRAAARRDHPGILRRRPVLRRQPQRRPRRRAVRPGPGPARRLPRSACPATTPTPPPTPSSAASSKPPARSSPPATRITVTTQPPRLLTRPPRSRPARRHRRPLVGRTPAPLRIRLTQLPRNTGAEIRVS